MTHVQYADKNVTTKDIEELLLNREVTQPALIVTKIFYTLQGEGPLAGQPSIFIRLSGCNRGAKKDCPWCDTFFTLDKGHAMSFSSIESEAITRAYKVARPIKETTSVTLRGGSARTLASLPFKPWIVLSGGEPLIQPHVVLFLKYMLDRGWSIQIESNGDFIPKNWTMVHKDHSWNSENLSDSLEEGSSGELLLVVSPKIGHRQKTYSKLKPATLQYADHLKYVVSAEPNSPYHNLPLETIQEFQQIHGQGSVYLSPVTVYSRDVNRDEVASIWDSTLVDQEATRKNCHYTAQLCQKFGLNLSLQSHLIFGME